MFFALVLEIWPLKVGFSAKKWLKINSAINQQMRESTAVAYLKLDQTLIRILLPSILVSTTLIMVWIILCMYIL